MKNKMNIERKFINLLVVILGITIVLSTVKVIALDTKTVIEEISKNNTELLEVENTEINNDDFIENDTETNLEENNTENIEDEIITEEELRETFKEYYEVLDGVNLLQEYAKEYIKENPNRKPRYNEQRLVYNFLRATRYNSSSWRYFIGDIDTSFNTYVKNKNEDLLKLKTLKEITLPNNEKTDIIHMFAAMDMMLDGYGNLGSWGGDLVQLISEVKKASIIKPELDVLEIAKEKLNSEKSSFSIYDMNANLDAFNLYNRYNKRTDRNLTLSAITRDYFEELTNEQRINEYIDNKYSFLTYDKENLFIKVQNDFFNTRYIKDLMSNYDISYNLDSLYINACLEVYVDYIYSIYNGEQVNNVYIPPAPIPEPNEKPTQTTKPSTNNNQNYIDNDFQDNIVKEEIILQDIENEILFEEIL